MKKLKAFGLLVLVLALGLVFIACGGGAGTGITGGEEGGGGGGGGGNEGGSTGNSNKVGGSGSDNPSAPAKVLTFSSGDYTIEIIQNLSLNKAVYQPKPGDFYKVYYKGEIVSEGKVTIGETTETGATTFTFTPDVKAGSLAEPFTATFEEGVLKIESGKIKGEKGEEITIPPLDAANYEAGVADKPPVINESKKTVAGIAYSRVDKDGYTYESAGTHYLLSEKEFNKALGELKKAWGEPDYTDRYIQTDNTSIAQGILESGEGVLFEVNNYKSIETWGTETGKNYRLGTRELVIAEYGDYYVLKAVEWTGDVTRTPNDGDPSPQPGVAAPKPDDKTKTLKFSGATEVSLTYEGEKVDYPKIGPTKNESAYYFLEISFDKALAIFKDFWGSDPQWDSSSFWSDDSSSIGPIAHAIFAVFKSTYADNGKEESYGLFRYSSIEDKWLGVGWWLRQ